MAIRELPPDGPPAPRRRPRVPWPAVALVLTAVAAGAAGWLARGVVEARPDPSAVVVGHADDFPVGSLTEVAVDAEFYDPYGVESPTAEPGTGPATRGALLVIAHDADAGIVAMLGASRWLGCRVVPVGRSEALQSHPGSVPAWFTGGFSDPCHGVLYAPTGEHLRGPGERGLDRFPVSYQADGTVLVDLTRPQRTGSAPVAGLGVTSGGAATS